ncbi:MAG: HD domain-containing protein [Planctomycetota bacterium]
MRLVKEIDKQAILIAVHEQYRLNWRGIHGVEHWARVMYNGLLLAEHVDADPRVVTLFALFHDACRFNDGHDPQHGSRGAALALSLRGKLFDLEDQAMDLLHDACCRHTHGLTEADVTVQVCWDADRLDLERVGITPSPRYLCTEQAKLEDVIHRACLRACANEHPDCLPDLARYS